MRAAFATTRRSEQLAGAPKDFLRDQRGGRANAQDCQRQQTQALPLVEERTYSDAEQQAGGVPGYKQKYSQLSAGAFKGSILTCILSERASFFVERTNAIIRKRFSVLPGHLRLHVMLSAQPRRCINGRIAGDDEVNVSLPTTPLDTSLPLDAHSPGQEYTGCWITLDLNSVIRAGVGEMTRDPNLAGRFQVSGWVTKILRSTIVTACQEMFLPGAPTSPKIAAAFEKTVLAIAAGILSAAFDAGEDTGHITLAHRARLLRRACEVIDEKLADDLTMQQLCSIVGASRRTLENVFVDALGVSPYQYVRTIRLNSIRKELLAEENHGVSIGDIAAKYGVWHLSRFAHDYKRLFGHLPSEGRRFALAA